MKTEEKDSWKMLNQRVRQLFIVGSFLRERANELAQEIFSLNSRSLPIAVITVPPQFSARYTAKRNGRFRKTLKDY